VTDALISSARISFHRALVEQVLFRNEDGLLSNADKGSRASCALAEAIASKLTIAPSVKSHLKGQQAGALFETLCSDYISEVFPRLVHLRPGKWEIGKFVTAGGSDIARYEQYSHLRKLADIASRDRELAAVLQSDYLITPDIVIARIPESDEELNRPEVIVDSRAASLTSLRLANNTLPILHASISCKWTLRSDRGQNVRTEGLNLVKNRKGHLPHVVFVTGEPMPARIASVAMGTGEIDCVYHFALPELRAAVNELRYPDAAEMLEIMIEGHRLRDISDLPLDLSV
jgi:hypothetical protein